MQLLFMGAAHSMKERLLYVILGMAPLIFWYYYLLQRIDASTAMNFYTLLGSILF